MNNMLNLKILRAQNFILKPIYYLAVLILIITINCSGTADITLEKVDDTTTEDPLDPTPPTPPPPPSMKTQTLSVQRAFTQITITADDLGYELLHTVGVGNFEVAQKDTTEGMGVATLDAEMNIYDQGGTLLTGPIDAALFQPYMLDNLIGQTIKVVVTPKILADTGIIFVRVSAKESESLNTMNTSDVVRDLNDQYPQRFFTFTMTIGDCLTFYIDQNSGSNPGKGKATIKYPDGTIHTINVSDSTTITTTQSGLHEVEIDVTNNLASDFGNIAVRMNNDVELLGQQLNTDLSTHLTNLNNFSTAAQGATDWTITAAYQAEVTAFNTSIAKLNTKMSNFDSLMNSALGGHMMVDSFMKKREKQLNAIDPLVDPIMTSIVTAMPLAAQQAYWTSLKNRINAVTAAPSNATEDGVVLILNSDMILFGYLLAQNQRYSVNTAFSLTAIDDALGSLLGNAYLDQSTLNNLVGPSLALLDVARSNTAAQKIYTEVNNTYNSSTIDQIVPPSTPTYAMTNQYDQTSFLINNLGLAMLFTTDGTVQDQVTALAGQQTFNAASLAGSTGNMDPTRRGAWLFALVYIVMKDNTKSTAALDKSIESYTDFSSIRGLGYNPGNYLNANQNDRNQPGYADGSNVGYETHLTFTTKNITAINDLRTRNYFIGLSAANQTKLDAWEANALLFLKDMDITWSATNNPCTQSGLYYIPPRYFTEVFANIRQ